MVYLLLLLLWLRSSAVWLRFSDHLDGMVSAVAQQYHKDMSQIEVKWKLEFMYPTTVYFTSNTRETQFL